MIIFQVLIRNLILMKVKNNLHYEFKKYAIYIHDQMLKLVYIYRQDWTPLFLKEILEKKANLNSYFTFGYISKYSDETQHLSLKKNQKSRSFICKFSINDYLKNLGVIQKNQEMPWGGPNVYFMQKLSQIAKKEKKK